MASLRIRYSHGIAGGFHGLHDGDELFLRTLALGDVEHREATTPAVGREPGFDLDVQPRLVLPQQPDLLGLPGLGCKDSLEEVVESRSIRPGEQLLETPPRQLGAPEANEACASQVHQANGAIGGEVEIADRREVEKVGVALYPGFALSPARLKFLVLHLQFDLMDLQFVLEPPLIGLGLRRLGCGFLFEPRLRRAP